MFITLEKIKDRYRLTKSISHYKFFDYEISLNSPEDNPLVIEVLSQIGRSHRKDILHLSVILANLLRNYSESGVHSAFTWSSSKLIPRCNGFGLARNRIKNLMILLIQNGFAECHKGSRDKSTRMKWRSKIRAEKKLTDLARSFYPDGLKLVSSDKRETIRLKSYGNEGSKGKLIDYKDTERTKRMRSRLNRYNRILEKSQITLDLAKADKDVSRRTDFTQTFTYRVFNEGVLNRGGRFYGGWWLDIPSEQRKVIVIDREPTVEIDFCTQALVLLYAIEGIHWGNQGIDGYEVPDLNGNQNMRKAVKRLFTIALNCQSDKKTIAAFHKDYKERKAKAQEEGKHFIRFPQEVLDNSQSVLDAFLDYHPRIVPHLWKREPIGLYLQYLDSLIADEILRVMTWKKIPVLCVHDSFICGVQEEDVLIDVIRDAYVRVQRGQVGLVTEGTLRLKRNFKGKEALLEVEIGLAP